MGGNHSKETGKKYPFMPEEDIPHLKTQFESACDGQQSCTRATLSKFWDGHGDAKLCKSHLDHLFNSKKSITFDEFIKLYADILYGTVDDKVSVLSAILTLDSANEIEVKKIIAYVKTIIASYLINLDVSKRKEFWTWKDKRFQVSQNNTKLLSEFMCKELPEKCNLDQFERWVATWSRLEIIHKSVFRFLYKFKGERDSDMFVPICLGVSTEKPFPSVLDISNIIFLNSSIPKQFRDQWRFLFSTATHGESFSKLLGSITKKGATVIIIEDEHGHVFGGFGSESWKLGPKFIGDDTSCLFKLRPEIDTYFPSGYNNNFQYLHIQQQTLPNGLGMGGQFGYFGFWLDAEFGKGHCSETCTTYRNYKMLSATKQFVVRHVEVWGVGPEPKDDDEQKEVSILDADKGATALLEMVGKSYASDGLREEPLDDE